MGNWNCVFWLIWLNANLWLKLLNLEEIFIRGQLWECFKKFKMHWKMKKSFLNGTIHKGSLQNLYWKINLLMREKKLKLWIFQLLMAKLFMGSWKIGTALKKKLETRLICGMLIDLKSASGKNYNIRLREMKILQLLF